MAYIFAKCDNLIYLDLVSFNIHNGTNIDYMFYWCYNLKEIKVKKNFVKDIENLKDNEFIKLNYYLMNSFQIKF